MRQLLLLIFTAFLFSIAGCKKESSYKACEELVQAMASDDHEKVKAVIVDFVNQMPSQTYSEQNLENLAASISGRCGISAEVSCFSCIQTYPEQTEIIISFIHAGASMQRTIDISYNSDHEIKVISMHD